MRLAYSLLFGTNRDRYHTAAEVQMYTGVSPVTERSGQKDWTHWRYSCPKFPRQTFVEWAGQSVGFSFWAKSPYDESKYLEALKSKGSPLLNCAIGG